MSASAPVAELLAAHPLPEPDGDKDERGGLVALAGSGTCPGAAVLVAVAALRVGAGRVQLATDPGAASGLGVALPEALVLPWVPSPVLSEPVAKVLAGTGAACLGPGLGEDAAGAAVAVVEALGAGTPLLLDAKALPGTRAALAAGGRVVVAPNVGEAGALLACDGDDPDELAAALAAELGVPVAVRGHGTAIAEPGGARWSVESATGLGTSGSGDVLAGVLTGLLAQGLPELVALAWATALHAEAGRLLAARRARPGYLARELLDALPGAVESLSRAVSRQPAVDGPAPVLSGRTRRG